MRKPRGLVKPGNVNLNTRRIILNPDGSYSTINSMTFTTDRGAVLVPGVNASRRLSNAEALAQYRKTGQHLGLFSSIAAADAYAKTLSKAQAKQYGPKADAAMRLAGLKRMK